MRFLAAVLVHYYIPPRNSTRQRPHQVGTEHVSCPVTNAENDVLKLRTRPGTRMVQRSHQSVSSRSGSDHQPPATRGGYAIRFGNQQFEMHLTRLVREPQARANLSISIRRDTRLVTRCLPAGTSQSPPPFSMDHRR